MPSRGFASFTAVLGGILCLLFLSAKVHAVQVYGTNGDTSGTYTTAPSNNFGFQNVAQVYDTVDTFYTSGVYLGNGWMLSAYHEVRSDNNGTGGFAFGSVILDGTTYNVAAYTAVRITDPVSHDPVDLAMYRLATIPNDPNLKTFTISSTAPTQSGALKLMGNGFDRADSLTYWNSSWQQTGSPSTYSGYLYASGNPQSMRWGNGVMSGTVSLDDGYGATSMLYSTFQAVNGSAMVAPGDSGGGVFYEKSSTWYLSGILLTNYVYNGQPGSTSVVGDEPLAANLATYSVQINSVAASNPVPALSHRGLAVLALALVGAGGWFVRDSSSRKHQV